MAKPAGLQTKLKNNDKKHPHVREEWMEAKKIGRPKQRWVAADFSSTSGHWEKVQ